MINSYDEIEDRRYMVQDCAIKAYFKKEIYEINRYLKFTQIEIYYKIQFNNKNLESKMKF